MYCILWVADPTTKLTPGALLFLHPACSSEICKQARELQANNKQAQKDLQSATHTLHMYIQCVVWVKLL